MPLAASWVANARPMPEDAPVTSAQGPKRCLSRWASRVVMTLLQNWVATVAPLRVCDRLGMECVAGFEEGFQAAQDAYPAGAGDAFGGPG